MSAYATDFLSANSSPFVKFTLASRVVESAAIATITFESEGLRKLAAGGYVRVNGTELQALPLPKFGFFYRAKVPKNDTYTLKYSIASGRPIVQHIFIDRPFKPKIPKVASRGKGVVMEFSGELLRPGETVSSDIGDPSEGSGRWTETLHPTASGNILTIPSTDFTNVRLGKSRLYVGVILRGYFPNDRLKYLQGYGDEATVNVID